jgi:hypothetical protein
MVNHLNCRCTILARFPAPRTEVEELGMKLAAQILLADRITRKILIPSNEEAIGFYLLERDDELKRVL